MASLQLAFDFENKSIQEGNEFWRKLPTSKKAWDKGIEFYAFFNKYIAEFWHWDTGFDLEKFNAEVMKTSKGKTNNEKYGAEALDLIQYLIRLSSYAVGLLSVKKLNESTESI